MIDFLLLGLECAVLIAIMWFVNAFFKRKEVDNPGYRYIRLLVLSILGIIGSVQIILLLPGQKASIDHVVTLLGIFLSGAIALSSTTFISNFMAGIMLSRIGNFSPGDFLSVGEHVGRVTKIGLLHTEIQTEHSNLTTFPNLFLVTNPCKVVRKSKTVVSAEVSLGYDIPHTKVEELLLKAADTVPLKDPFVHITDLGDYSVVYRASGVLENAKHLISTKSKLREEILDALHGAGVEIVSPAFMNTRSLSAHSQVLSPADDSDGDTLHPAPESVIFDKADEAESIENIRKKREELQEEIETLQKRKKEKSDSDDLLHLDKEIRWRKTSINFLKKRIEAAETSKE